ncbi:MAG: hypothetical protein IH597_05370 [Bacteroidales bacterium]|nr:hypothetical protein [Bacteroidales bacterium]
MNFNFDRYREMRHSNYISLLFAILFIAILFGSTACSRKGKVNKEAIKVEMLEVTINRYEKALFSIDTNNTGAELIRLQPSFLPFLNADLSDADAILQIQEFVTDTAIRQIYAETMSAFPELGFLEDDLTLAFKHIRYYFPEWQPPMVYSYVSGLFYEMPVKYTGTELIIAIDMYLGESYEMYRMVGIPQYKIRQMQIDYLLADCIEMIIRNVFIKPAFSENMLDKMIDEGKILYFLDTFLPWIADEYKMGYTVEDIKWCKKNESNMWAYFIENELLFSSDPLVINRFINDGPFTTAFHNDSPARAALWVGWQIVKAYADNSPDDVHSKLLSAPDSREILKASGYKPSRFVF